MAEAFQNKGGIEATFGRQNRDILGDFLKREFDVVPEDAQKSKIALSQPLLSLFEDSIRHTKEGVLLISTLRRSKDPNAKPGALVERWSMFDDPVNQDSAFDAERALREHIAGSYLPGGLQYESREKAFRQANVILKRLQSGPMNTKMRESLLSSTRTQMAKYFSSAIYDRVNTAEQYIKALGPDRLGRANQPAGRVIVTSARRHVIEDRFVDEVIALKNLHRASLIDSESSFENAALFQSGQIARTAAGIEDGRSFNKYIAEKMFPDMHYFLSPEVIKMKPYANLAAKLRFLLFAQVGIDGVSHDDISMGLARYIGNEAYDFADRYPFFKNLDTAQHRRDRLIDFANICDDGLEKIRGLHDNPPPKPPGNIRESAEKRLWNRLNTEAA